MDILTVRCNRSHFGVQLWWEPIYMDLKIQKLETLKIIKSRNQLPRQTNSGAKFWNSSTKHKPQTCNNPPTFRNLHLTTKMPPMPTPLLSSSSPSAHEWTHGSIMNFPPEQDQDSLHQLLLTLWLFDTWLVSKFHCCPWTSWKIA